MKSNLKLDPAETIAALERTRTQAVEALNTRAVELREEIEEHVKGRQLLLNKLGKVVVGDLAMEADVALILDGSVRGGFDCLDISIYGERIFQANFSTQLSGKYRAFLFLQRLPGKVTP